MNQINLFALPLGVVLNYVTGVQAIFLVLRRALRGRGAILGNELLFSLIVELRVLFLALVRYESDELLDVHILHFLLHLDVVDEARVLHRLADLVTEIGHHIDLRLGCFGHLGKNRASGLIDFVRGKNYVC